MSKLKAYIAEALETLHTQRMIDYGREADLIIEKMLDPNYQPRKAPAPKKNITKVESYNQFLEHYQGRVYQKVYSILLAAESPLSRSQIVNRTGLRMSTVCGRIAELMEAGAVSVVGYEIDPETDRKVETLEVNFKEVK